MNQMYQIQITMTLQEPLVLSQSNATSGAHETLNYIPGATLLGSLAAKAYQDFKKQGFARDIFHSGKVRFKNAYPLADSRPTQPVPMCLHYDKLDKKNLRNYLQQVFNIEDDGKVIQGKQQREGFIQFDEKINIHKPKKSLQMRTAIGEKTGTAQTGQLFGYQMLNEGILFQTQIDCDESAHADAILDVLNAQKHLFIGRSRTAQFGRVAIEVEKISPNTTKAPIVKINHQDHLVLWLASDLALYNANGQPCLAPSMEDLGLVSQATLVADKSFIRTRQFAPFNGYRRSYDLERQVIEKGSVLTYKLDSEWQPEDLIHLQAGLGCYVESGLGQVVLSEDFLALLQKERPELNEHQTTGSLSISKPQNSTLLKFLEAKVSEQNSSQKHLEVLNKATEELIALYQSARKYNNIQAGRAYGPTKTQWGDIRGRGNFATSDQLMHDLFESKDAYIKTNDEAWGISNGSQTFREWLENYVKNNSTELIRDLCAKISNHKSLLNLMAGHATSLNALEKK